MVQLVGPPRVPHPAVDGRGDLAFDPLAAQVPELVGELLPPPLHELGHSIEHLAPVVRRGPGPPRKRLARRANGVPEVLARSPGWPGDDLAVRAGHRIGPAGLRAREGPSDGELVRLPDVQPGRLPLASAPPTGRRHRPPPFRSRYGSRPCRPPSRPNPLSL